MQVFQLLKNLHYYSGVMRRKCKEILFPNNNLKVNFENSFIFLMAKIIL